MDAITIRSITIKDKKKGTEQQLFSTLSCSSMLVVRLVLNQLYHFSLGMKEVQALG